MTTADNDAQETTRVLVVDDEEVVHASLRKILSKLGYSVEGVPSAREALARLETSRFHLIITDLMMPEMNGIELMRTLRERGCNTPMLMVTGYPTIRTAVQAMRLGAVDYVAKPFTRKELLSPVQRALRIDDGPAVRDDEPATTISDLKPGTVMFLPHHAWARYEQDGTFLVGVEDTFLRAAGPVFSISPPDDVEMVEQGFVGLVLTNTEGEAHGVAMPLSGQVMARNPEVFDAPKALRSDVWVLRVLPSQLESEIGQLARRS
jgi:CheY-like chemotaxis protein/glycine cleavage system H lipoate-binding protein